MFRIVAIGVFVFLASWAFAQDGAKTKFGVGFTIGLNTSVGMGAKVNYTPWRFVQAELGIGKTAYNGFKGAGGLKFYPLKTKDLNPYIGCYYSITNGQTVRSQYGQATESYKTFSNQYLHPHAGFSIFGDQLNHTFAVGYSLLLGDYEIEPDSGNKSSRNQEKIENRLKGGFMISYTIGYTLRTRP